MCVHAHLYFIPVVMNWFLAISAICLTKILLYVYNLCYVEFPSVLIFIIFKIDFIYFACYIDEIQTHKWLKRTLFIMTKHNMQISGVIPFFKLQQNT